jgi:hypothetical protein
MDIKVAVHTNEVQLKLIVLKICLNNASTLIFSFIFLLEVNSDCDLRKIKALKWLLWKNQWNTANEGPVRILYKCLVPIYVFSEIKLLFPKQNYNLSPSTYTHISVRDLYISRISLPILQQGSMWTDPGNLWISHRHMNVEIGTEAEQFPEKEYINVIFLAVNSGAKN